MVALIGCLFVLAVNFFLAFFSSVPDFATELPIYNYVETNATTVAGLTLAIAIFVVVTFDKEVHVLGTTTARKFLWLTLWPSSSRWWGAYRSTGRRRGPGG